MGNITLFRQIGCLENYVKQDMSPALLIGTAKHHELIQ